MHWPRPRRLTSRSGSLCFASQRRCPTWGPLVRDCSGMRGKQPSNKLARAFKTIVAVSSQLGNILVGRTVAHANGSASDRQENFPFPRPPLDPHKVADAFLYPTQESQLAERSEIDPRFGEQTLLCSNCSMQWGSFLPHGASACCLIRLPNPPDESGKPDMFQC